MTQTRDRVAAQAFCVKFFLVNKGHRNWQPIHQSFMLRVAI